MPFGISSGRYAAVVFSGFGCACLGSFCVHLVYRPDQVLPNMVPYIEAQRDVIRKVQQRKNQQPEEKSTETPAIRTATGNFNLEDLNPETGLPKNIADMRPTKARSRFWMYVPVPREAVADLVDSPIVEVSPPPNSRN